MNYFYYQQEGGDEKWKPIKADKLITLEDAMFSTILSVDVPVSDTPSREQLNEIKYKGPLYFDLDDATSPASTAVFALQLCKKLEAEGVFPQQLEIYATGGKGFHIIVPEEIFLAKPPKAGINHLPYIYKEMAYELAVESMDFRVYTGKKGRMFRRPNVKRPNGLYKVLISYAELTALAETSARDTAQAEEDYKELCSTPRRALEVETDAPELAGGLMAMFDQCKAKVTKSAKSRAKAKPITLPKELPSFEAMLRGEGIKSGIGFQNLATQIAVTAHAKGMSRTDLLAAAEGLCNSHQSDGSRYNTPSKRRAELGRMWDYMEDNPCYGYMPKVITSMLTHTAPDLYGLSVTGEEVAQDIAESDAAIENGDEPAAAEFEHANLFMTRQGAFTLTDAGPKQVTAISFDNVTELISPETNQVSVVEADVLVAGKLAGRQTFELDTFNSVSNLNRVAMRYGQSFSGNDIQARGMYMRLVERARKNDNRMYVTNREGLDFISIPFHEDERMRNGFMVWSDGENVVTEPGIADTGLKLKFVGYPDPLGQFQTDLSAAPPLMQWIKEGDNKELMRSFLENMLKCQHPTFIGKMLGWYTACHYRMLFHGVYKQFPLLHINGFAGQGKCLRKGTLVIKADGTRAKIEDIQVGDTLLGPDGGVRNVLALGRGRETMYEVTPTKGEPYYVNENHILSLKRSFKGRAFLSDGTVVPADQEILNVTVKVWSESSASTQKFFKGYRAEAVEFHREKQELPVPPYILGAWLGDGTLGSVTLTKPECGMVSEWVNYAESLKLTVSKYLYGTECPRWAIVAGRWETNPATEAFKVIKVLDNKHIPDMYLYASIEDRLQLLAGLLDSDGHQSDGGFDWISKDEQMAKDFTFLCQSLGFAAYMKPCTKGIKSSAFTGTYYRVSVSGDCERIPTRDKKAPVRKQIKNHLVTGLSFKRLEEEDYYGVVLDGDHLFLLGDFTVTHNTQMTLLFTNLHYYKAEAKLLSPSSTLFAVGYSAASSASVPLVLDEFKPAEMPPAIYDKFKLMLRDAYNCRSVERGGGTRDNADYRAVHRTQLAAPICFIAEAAENESALMERVVLLTLVKPPSVRGAEYRERFELARGNKEFLGIIGKYISAQIVKRYSVDKLREEFDEIYSAERRALMLQPGEVISSPEEYQRKSTAKDRTVFNYAVVKFGLTKFQRIVQGLFGAEFDSLFEQMFDTVCDSMEEIQAQTVPEWLKVLNTFADMTKINDLSPFFLQKGKDYAYVQYAGKNCLELYTNSAYFKYRAYCAAANLKPLFGSSAAFLHAMNHVPALVEKGTCIELNVAGGSHILDLDELRANGFLTPDAD